MVHHTNSTLFSTIGWQGISCTTGHAAKNRTKLYENTRMINITQYQINKSIYLTTWQVVCKIQMPYTYIRLILLWCTWDNFWHAVSIIKALEMLLCMLLITQWQTITNIYIYTHLPTCIHVHLSSNLHYFTITTIPDYQIRHRYFLE